MDYQGIQGTAQTTAKGKKKIVSIFVTSSCPNL